MPRSADRDEPHRLGALGPRVVRVAGGIGIAALLASVVLGSLQPDGIERLSRTYLVSFSYVLSLALGALFFVILQHLTRSGWSVVLRRLAETFAATLCWLAILFIPVALSVRSLYGWTQPAADDALLAWKQPYLNLPFFYVRAAVYLVLWAALARFFHSRSTRQDGSGEPALTLSMERWSAPAMILYAFSVTFAAFDWFMSTDAHWFSTIYGVYYFAGSVMGFLALMALAAIALRRAGRLTRSITIDHYHDVGKLLFGFMCFWAYIAFSQYMLIWYANIPEETAWLVVRQSGPWGSLVIVLSVGHFVLPFFGLMSRSAKRRTTVLGLWAAWLLVMHWVDLYWLLMPRWSGEHIPFGVIDVTCLIGLVGVFIAAAARVAARHPLLCVGDPRLAESIALENA
ncbi:MAG: quinol:cytochrome C oxidoreductase [Phycisphaerae bacterium]|nr:quinol:cytochrome C oxidoreductase [Phycisphaerae bacterium]